MQFAVYLSLIILFLLLLTMLWMLWRSQNQKNTQTNQLISQSQNQFQILSNLADQLLNNQGRLENLLVSQDFSTFSLLEQKRIAPEITSVEDQEPSGTDMDEYNRWLKSRGGAGVGDVIFDDPDDADDAREFDALLSSGDYSTPE